MSVPYSSDGPVLFGARNQQIVWPTRTQPYADKVTPPPTLPPRNDAGLLFDADFPNHGMSKYQTNNIANDAAVLDVDYGTCADPTGSGRIVGWCDSIGGRTNTNEFGRSSMLTRRWVYPALRSDNWGNYAHLATYYIDPVSAFSTTGDWCSIQGFHGPPFIGPSSTGLMVVYDPATQKHYFRVGNAVGRAPQAEATVPIGKWFQVLSVFRYSTAVEGGWFDLFINETEDAETGWRRIPIEGGFRVPFDMISDVEGNAWLTDPTRGPSYASWGVYGNRRAVVYCASHRLGTTVASVMPSGWSGTIAGIRPDTMWPTPTAPTPSYTPNPSNGTGGAMTNTLSKSFTSGSLTSAYHINASHLTGSTPKPLLVHLHGDGYQEYTNMATGSTTGVANSYLQVAKDAGALFVLPRTPDTTNGTWWSKNSSTTWLVALLKDILAKYNVDLNRVFWSGYSGGAEEITYNLTCDYHNLWTGGVGMMLGGGGATGLTGFTGTPTANFKTRFLMRWEVGDLDNGQAPSDTTIDALTESQVGKDWYGSRGFNVKRNVLPGVNHYGSEALGPGRLRAAINESNTMNSLPTI